MGVRPATLAGQWYPGDRAGCSAFLERVRCAPVPDPLTGPLLGGVVPHAGWVFSGETASVVFRALERDRADRTLVVLGAVHREPLTRPALSTDGAWETPLGDLAVDEALAEEIREACSSLVDVDADAHPAGENSIELQTALIRGLLPGSRFVPIMVPPTEVAVEFGTALGRALAVSEIPAVVVASTDLTHYGYGGWQPAGVGERAVRWVKEENDRRFLDLVASLEAERIVPEAHASRNACGAGATAAAVSAVRAMGAREGLLLAQTTSHDVHPASGSGSIRGVRRNGVPVTARGPRALRQPASCPSPVV